MDYEDIYATNIQIIKRIQMLLTIDTGYINNRQYIDDMGV